MFLLCLLGSDRAGGASILAGAAVDADARVHDVMRVALRDCGNGAGVCTGTAGNASIADRMSHDVTSFSCRRSDGSFDMIVSQFPGKSNLFFTRYGDAGMGHLILECENTKNREKTRNREKIEA